jgi:hypothetical protein
VSFCFVDIETPALDLLRADVARNQVLGFLSRGSSSTCSGFWLTLRVAFELVQLGFNCFAKLPLARDLCFELGDPGILLGRLPFLVDLELEEQLEIQAAPSSLESFLERQAGSDGVDRDLVSAITHSVHPRPCFGHQEIVPIGYDR